MSSEQLGGWSPWKEAGANEIDICKKVKAEVEAKTRRKFPVFQPLDYRSQIVNGTNYEIQVYVGNNQCAALTVHVAHQKEPQLGKVVLFSLPGVDFF
ncbi:leukocyte cysteine proteinase inhibitor 1-like [Colossoma macropomum]|uniref:leukocyte cysteine proteinase inhibitor 1-like n=1 Tax=Colossoma macropomum TaxID=42526 RepID=UPI001864796B|nr:leukocyte cysteine proteinase inhibitor 1-like [Colossoma macropomum]